MSYIKIAQKAKRYIKEAAIEHNIPEMLVGGLGGGLIGGVAGRTLGSKGRKRNLYTLLGALTGAGVGAYAGNQFGNHRVRVAEDEYTLDKLNRISESMDRNGGKLEQNVREDLIEQQKARDKIITKAPIMKSVGALFKPRINTDITITE